MEEKICSLCGESKSTSEFSPRSDRKIAYRSKCKCCERLCRNEYNEQNRLYVRGLQQKWVDANPEKSRAKVKKYQATDKGKVVARKSDKKRLKSHNEYARQRYFTDPQWNMNMKLRRRVDRVLRQRKISKSTKTMELLGCTYVEFNIYIESRFTPNMSWDKILSGEIHLDHIRPCASFDLTDIEQQKVCFHYSNLQPLWAKDNLSKGARLI